MYRRWIDRMVLDAASISRLYRARRANARVLCEADAGPGGRLTLTKPRPFTRQPHAVATARRASRVVAPLPVNATTRVPRIVLVLTPRALSTDRSGRQDCGVPAISRFLGITIAMFFDDHDPPHFHARHADGSAKVRIDTLELIVSTLPLRQERFVLAWAELHQQELVENWSLARAGETLKEIEPLR